MAVTPFRHAERFPDSLPAADIIVPHLLEAAGRFDSAVDVGGGVGAWCLALKRHGTARVLCIDDPAVRREDLLVSPDEFLGCDLTRTFPGPVRHDLAVCLEFAEHLPSSRADQLLDFLTASAEVVLFSAAIPGQPSPFHVNEQPAEFWRQRFEERGFSRFDCIRPRILSDERVPYWYRQNTYVFATAAAAEARRLMNFPITELPRDFELVHRRVLETYRNPRRPHLKDVPAVVRRALKTRLARD